jgi:cytochrome bd-type quinol oxidase subunit 2
MMDKKQGMARRSVLLLGAVGVALGWMPFIAEFIVLRTWAAVPSWWYILWLSWCGALLILAILCSAVSKPHERLAWGFFFAAAAGILAPRIF